MAKLLIVATDQRRRRRRRRHHQAGQRRGRRPACLPLRRPNAVARLSTIDTPAPDGWREYITRQQPIGRDREDLRVTFDILSKRAEKLSHNGDAKHRQDLNRASTT